jgi:hypothetical protein
MDREVVLLVLDRIITYFINKTIDTGENEIPELELPTPKLCREIQQKIKEELL